jgi:glycosyltransferase involved in cell wall biosynthesis
LQIHAKLITTFKKISQFMTSASKPLITIIIAVYNGAKTFQQCIDSVFNQSFQNKELIIIDGGSNDGTVDLLKANQGKISYWISEPDKGIYNAWNKGLAEANGEWILFLGADDYFWNASVLQQSALHLMTLQLEIRVAYGQVMLLGDNDSSLYAAGGPWAGLRKKMKYKMSIPHTATFHRHSLFELHGMFDESYQIAGDYELLLRELKTSEAAFISDIIVTGMRLGGISNNPQNSFIALREARRAQIVHGHNIPSATWLMAFLRVGIRTLLWRVLGEKHARKLLDFTRRMSGRPAYWTKT